MAPDDPLADFEAERPRLFGLAYRMLGSAEDAEDVVQDAFLRWNGVDRARVLWPSAWLAKVVTNLCVNRLTAASAQRERYVGPWLPEPVLTGGGALGPLETAEQRESVSFALLVLLERLTPAERAVFVLREAFGYAHRDVAEVLELSEVNCRQLHRRARQRLREPGAPGQHGPERPAQEQHGRERGPDGVRPRFTPEHRQRTALLERFLAAAGDGDLPGLERLLSADVVSWADGGGEIGAARRPVLGRDRVARYLAGGVERFARHARWQIAEINGEPAVLGLVDDDVLGVLVPEVTQGRISALRIVASPRKLAFLTRQLAGPSRSGGLAGPNG
ncbi:sigma-70 family RNA polymerase sigma factor [Micromonospora sp. NPDC049559]|uniref:sigma-70 family RNA polymerase sigma factor n=1 Tax=Micromonospora sp. NPDC049559 TaxID=3155923 RepID=UPI003421B17F